MTHSLSSTRSSSYAVSFYPLCCSLSGLPLASRVIKLVPALGPCLYLLSVSCVFAASLFLAGSSFQSDFTSSEVPPLIA